jgi:hypothetical protein
VMALRSGEVVGCGPLPDTLDDRLLSRCFDLAITVDHRDGRFTARRARSVTPDRPD